MPTDQGYDFDNVITDNQPNVQIDLSYEDAHDVVLDGLLNELGQWHITPTNASHVAATLLALLVDAHRIIQDEQKV
jgi:hypothetical protein